MSPKELLYIEDALGHAQHMENKCRCCADQLQDQELKQVAERLANKHKMMLNELYQLLN